MPVQTIPTTPPARLPRPEARFVHRDGDLEWIRDGERPISVPPRASYDDLVSLTLDGGKLIVGSNVRMREVDLETLAMRDLLLGPWLTGVRCVADGLVCVLGRAGTHRLDRSDPDVAEMKSVKDMPKHLTWFDVTTPGMLFVLDVHARPERALVASIPCDPEHIDAVLGGRVLIVAGSDGTTIYGVKAQQLVVMARLRERIGRVSEVDRRVYGDACEIVGLEEAWGAAVVDEARHPDVAIDGEFTVAPVDRLPEHPDKARDASPLLGPGGWQAMQRLGEHSFALTAHERGYRCVLVGDAGVKAIEPAITGPSFKYELSVDGRRCVIAERSTLWSVDCETAVATEVARGKVFVSATIVGDLIAAIHRDDVDGRLDLYAGRVRVDSIPCGRYDSLFALHDGGVLMIASEYAPTDAALRAHLIAVRGTETRYLGNALAPLKHGASVRSRSYVQDAAGRTWEVLGLAGAIDRAFAREPTRIGLHLSAWERIEPCVRLRD